MRLVNRCYNHYSLAIGCWSNELGWTTNSEHIATISTDTLEHLRFQASLLKYKSNVDYNWLKQPKAVHMSTIDQAIDYLWYRFEKAKLKYHVRSIEFDAANMLIKVRAYCTLMEFTKINTVIRGVPLEQE